jgi:hypothetical protein
VPEELPERAEIREGARRQRVQVEGALRLRRVEQPDPHLRPDPRGDRGLGVLRETLVDGQVGRDDMSAVGRRLVAGPFLQLVLRRVDAPEHVVGRSHGLEPAVTVLHRDAGVLHFGQYLDGCRGDPAQRMVEITRSE